jgi:hypothetical protein
MLKIPRDMQPADNVLSRNRVRPLDRHHMINVMAFRASGIDGGNLPLESRKKGLRLLGLAGLYAGYLSSIAQATFTPTSCGVGIETSTMRGIASAPPALAGVDSFTGAPHAPTITSLPLAHQLRMLGADFARVLSIATGYRFLSIGHAAPPASKFRLVCTQTNDYPSAKC